MFTNKPLLRLMQTEGWWQVRLWLPNHTLRLSCERKRDIPGWIFGGWERTGKEH